MKRHSFNAKKMQDALKECSALVLIIILIWSIVCASKGIWPFGQMLLDIGDMAEECVPMYTHLWDVLHGRKSLFFDWHTGLGNNMAGSVLYFGLISPFNLFFLFVKREFIETSMSVYILIKLVATGFSIRFLLRKWFSELSPWIYLSFSLLYVFSPFNMQYYYAPMWLDISFMFPLVMYGYFLLMNEGKRITYIVCLAVTCMMSFQHTYMLFLMLLFLTGCLPLLSKEKYQIRLPELLLSTLTAMMLVSWIWLPGAIQILSAGRAGDNHGLVEIWSSIWFFFTAKWMKLLNMGIPMAFFLLYGVKYHKEKGVRFFGFIIILLCAPVILESTNLLWHGGSYQGYTMRFSYMLAFWIITAGAYACNKKICLWDTAKEMAANGISIISFLILAAMTVIQYFLLKSDMTVYKNSIPSIDVILIVVITVIAGCGLLIGKEWREKGVFIIVIAQTIMLAMTTVIVSGEKESSFFAMLEKAADSGETKNMGATIRIKSLDVELSHNYPMIMRRNAVSNYSGVNSAKQLDGVVNLGHARVGYRMSDYGGTLFSDALLGVREVISREDVNKNLYEYQVSYGDYDVYRSLYSYKQGIKVRSGSKVNGNPFACQNQLARQVLGKELMDIIIAEGSEAEVEIDDKGVLYLYASEEELFEEVTVSDEKTGEIHRLIMPESGWMNGILELGTWENTKLTVRIKSKNPVQEFYCAVLPLKRFIENEPEYFDGYVENQHKAEWEAELKGASEGDCLFLPLYHDEGWKCVVNDKETDIGEIADVFMGIPLQEGDNRIKLSYLPPGFRMGILITILGVMVLPAVLLLSVDEKWKAVTKILLVMDKIVFTVLLLIFYVIPVVFLVKGCLEN